MQKIKTAQSPGSDSGHGYAFIAVTGLLGIVTLWLILAAPPGVAQETANGTGLIEEVLITAQRRETELGKTAAAISAYSNDDLLRLSVEDIEDVGLINPSLQVSMYQGEAQVYIRGIGTPIVIGGTDSATAIHMDGVYLSRAAAAVPAFFDVERIEVVKGPQGTLYGRNATAGSINVISKGPTDTWEGTARLTLGNYDLTRAFVAAGGPLSDRVGVRLALQTNDRRGYTTVTRPNPDPSNSALAITDDVEDKDEIYARLRLDWQISDTLDLQLSGDYYQADDQATTWHFLNRGFSANPFFVDFIDEEGRLSAQESREMFSDIQFYNKPRIWGTSARLDWQIGEYTLSSLTAYRKTEPLNRNDLDFSDVFASDQVRGEEHEQVSQEFQLSSPGGGRLEWILGAFFFDEENIVRNEYFLPRVPPQFGFDPDPDCCLLLLNGTTETQAFAVFGDGRYDLNDQWALLFGARYSDETRDGSNIVEFVDVPAALAPLLNNIADFEEESWDAFTPKIGVEYTADEDTFLYATVARGFKSGGFNIGSYQNEPFDPEFIWSYELGTKISRLGRRLSLNAALFYYDYSDLQVQDVENNNVLIRNAAEAEVWGFEIDGTYLPTDWLRVDWAATWMQPEFSDYLALDTKRPELGVQDLSGNNLPKAPDLQFYLGIETGFEVGRGLDLTLRADYAWQDEIFFNAFSDDLLRQDSYGWLKFRATLGPADGRWQLAAFVDNATDETVVTNAIFTGDIVGARAAGNLAPPRTYAVEAIFNF